MVKYRSESIEVNWVPGEEVNMLFDPIDKFFFCANAINSTIGVVSVLKKMLI
jgi:hypothetical protein